MAYASEILDEPRPYRVMLPSGYSETPEKQYPLLLLLDGQRYGDLVATNATFLSGIDEIPEHLIVALDSGNRLRDYSPTDSPYWEGDGGGKEFLEFLKTELLPHLEKTYRVKNTTRIIWGHSAAGLFAMYTLYAAPGLFDAHLVNDGSLDWDDQVSERLLQKFLTSGASGKSFLYFNSSYLRTAIDPGQNFFGSMASMLENHAPNHLRWVYDPLPDETHASIPMMGSIRALRSLYNGYKVSEAVMFDGLDAVIQHYDSVKGEIGAPEKIPEAVLNDLGYMLLFESPDDALAAFELATRLYPTSANAWDSLSDACIELEKYDMALTAIENSIKLARIKYPDKLEDLNEKHARILELIKNKAQRN